MLCTLLSLIGALVLIRVLASLGWVVYTQFFRAGRDVKTYLTPGAWAVVTGASDGIGKAFAIALAKKGFNIVLASRTKAKLDAVAEQIRTVAPNVKTMVYEIDFSLATTADYDKFGAALKDLSVTVLVNNAGISNDYPEYFLETDPKRDREIVAVNITAVNEVTRVVLPLMVAKSKGLVYNISSASCLIPTPLLSVYGASKAYVTHWSQALAAEYANKGIHVECQIPFFVVSNMSKRSRATLTVPSPETYVAHALKKSGLETSYCPYSIHALMAWPLQFVPQSLLIGQNKKMHEDIRRRALVKRQAQKKE